MVTAVTKQTSIIIHDYCILTIREMFGKWHTVHQNNRRREKKLKRGLKLREKEEDTTEQLTETLHSFPLSLRARKQGCHFAWTRQIRLGGKDLYFYRQVFISFNFSKRYIIVISSSAPASKNLCGNWHLPWKTRREKDSKAPNKLLFTHQSYVIS